MFECVQRAIEQDDLLRFGSRIGVAVSGGADSVFLLHALAYLKSATAVIHVNHQLRGSESDADEQFVTALAETFHLPVLTHREFVASGNLEQEARRIRYAFFQKLITDGIVHAIATGHTRSDQAETVLFRFLRGSGTAGLSGIRRTTTNRIIRPILDLDRSEVRTFLTEQRIGWREDSSNSNPQFARNRIRTEFLPALAASFNPNLTTTLAATASLAQVDEDFWKIETDRLEARYAANKAETVILDSGDLKALHVAQQRRLIRRVIEKVRGDLRSIDFPHIEAVRAVGISKETSGRVQVPGADVMRSFQWLRVAPLGHDARLERNFEVVVRAPGKMVVSDRGLAISLERVLNRNVYNNQVNAFDWERCAGTLLLRNWQPGDQFQIPGRQQSEKIKSLFQEFRIPIWERRSWPVISLRPDSVNGAGSEQIVWARQFGISADFQPAPDSSVLFAVLDPRALLAESAADAVSQVTESNCGTGASIELARARVTHRCSGEPGAEVL